MTARIAVAGENIIDLVPAGDGLLRPLPGGSPANIAAAVARLGTPASMIARISRDGFGAAIRDRLAADGVRLDLTVDAPEPSSLALVTLDERARASYTFWVTGTADWGWREGELPEPLPGDVCAVHVGSLAVQLEPGGSALLGLVRRERERGAVTVSLDPNVRPAIIPDMARGRRRIEDLVRPSHLVKVSDEDLAHLYPDEEPVAAARRWLDLGPYLVVLTLGAEGAVAVNAAGEVPVPAPEVRVADTVGAGDAFMGALLSALEVRELLGGDRHERLAILDTGPLGEIVEVANAAAALTCTRAGAVPPTAEELTAFLTR
ncbi:MAG: carbohydrate kinase [Streptosporangiales bacterium]|nr:carbohydrate kinase [Streptosporangiales bacterium]